MPKQYAREFRSAGPSAAGERVNSLSKEFGVSEGTLYLWKRQVLDRRRPCGGHQELRG